MTKAKKNTIKNLYPMTKFYIALLMAIVGVLMPTILSKFIWFVLISFMAILSGVSRVFFRRVISSIGVLFVVLIIIQTLFHPGEEVIFEIWHLQGKMEGLLFALNLGLNLLSIGGALIWNFSVTSEKDFVYAIEQKGLSPRAAYVILSTLQMAPILKSKSEVIMDAQRARGVETEGSLITRAKVFIPTMVPLVLSSISGIEERALTLEARGFAIEAKPTYLYSIEETSIDKKINKLVLTLLILALIGRFILWVI